MSADPKASALGPGQLGRNPEREREGNVRKGRKKERKKGGREEERDE